MSVILETKDLSAAYGKVQVLWDVSLSVNEGDFVSIIGANGAGKTTLLRVISGLIPVKSGEVRAFGEPLQGLSAAKIVKRGVGHVPEGRQLFGEMTVKENLESGADYLPNARKEAATTRKFVYDLFPRLEERKGQLAGTLSGGRAADARHRTGADEQTTALTGGRAELGARACLDEDRVSGAQTN